MILSFDRGNRLHHVATIVAMGLAAAVTSTVTAALPANTAWYSGDPDLGGWGNGWSSNPNALQHWQPFEVTSPSGWTIDTVFSLGWGAAQDGGEWSIRSGMGTGNPGTTISTGSVPGAIISQHAGVNVIEIDIPDLFLPQGIYWLHVSTSNGVINGSSGANSIGSTPGLHSIRNWNLFGQYYQPYSDPRLSSGVTLVIPTPGAAAMLGLGGLVMSRRRRTR